jgi:hypothetical protein
MVCSVRKIPYWPSCFMPSARQSWQDPPCSLVQGQVLSLRPHCLASGPKTLSQSSEPVIVNIVKDCTCIYSTMACRKVRSELTSGRLST